MKKKFLLKMLIFIMLIVVLFILTGYSLTGALSDKEVDTNFANIERVTIRTFFKKFSVDTVMNGFKRMSEYIVEM